jgi:Mrp family chromosome partitioning ATPase
MTLFLEEAKANYDFIFIDTPPLALVTDAFVLSSMVDHTLFIIRQNFTPKTLLNTIDDMYRAGKMGRISIVLNDIYKSGPGYGYGYGYGYAYGYGYGTYGYGRKKKDHGQGYYED